MIGGVLLSAADPINTELPAGNTDRRQAAEIQKYTSSGGGRGGHNNCW